MNKRKAIVLTIVVFFVGIIAMAGSYAFWSWSSTVNKNIVFNTAGNLKNYIVYDEGQSQFAGELNPSNSYTNGIHSTISIYKTTDVSLLATIHMDVNRIGDAMKSSQALKWVVTEGTPDSIGATLAQGNFVGVNAGDTLTLVPDLEVSTTETFYTIWIWLDSSLNPSSDLSGETLDTNVWTEINQVEGAEDVYKITRLSVNYQTITATVVDSKAKITAYSVSTSNTNPGTWTTITPAANQAKVYTLNYNATSANIYYVWFKDALDRTVVSEAAVVTTVDNTQPSCTWGTFNPTQIQNNETSQIYLTCTDGESGISVHDLKTSDITVSNNKVNVTNITKTSVTNGYRYTITVTGTTNDGTSTLTLDNNLVRNGVGLGNTAVTSGTITVANTYTVTYNTGNNNCPLDTTVYAQYTATYGTAFNVVNPTCQGYSFSGWTATGLDTTNAMYGSDSANAHWSDGTTPVKGTTQTYFNNLAVVGTNAVTLTANWSSNEYTITYYLGNVSNGSNSIGTSTCTYNASCTLKTFANLGATFPNSNNKWGIYGWSATQTGMQKAYNDGATITYTTAGNMNLYALGVRTFNFYSGIAPSSVTSSKSQNWNPYSSGSSYYTAFTVPTPTSIASWTAIGYKADNNADSNVSIASSKFNTSYKPSYSSFTVMNLSAKYSRTLTLNFDVNGAEGTVNSITATQYYNSKTDGTGVISTPSFTLPAAPSRAGYTFNGWGATSSATSGAAAGSSYTGFAPAVNVSAASSLQKTLYATWTVNELVFADKTITKTFSTSSQTESNAVDEATNGSGTYTYTITGGNSNNYFSLSGRNLTIAANTPANTSGYQITITANDSVTGASKAATYKIIINKHATTISLNPTSGTLTYGTNVTSAITTNGDGTLSCASSDETVATCSVSGTTLTIIPQANTTDNKTATITVTQAAGTNYAANTTGATYAATVNRKTLTCPDAPADKTYSGSSQNSGISCPTGSTAGGDQSGTNASDSYSQTCSANAGYKFASTCSVTWKIKKYKPSVAFDPTTTTSGSVAANSTATFKAKPTTISSCQGTLTATSASTSTVTVANASGGTYGASASFSNVANNTSKTFYYKGIGYSSGTALTVSYVPTDTANCDSATTITFTASVTRATQTVSLSEKTGMKYTGSAQAANTATVSPSDGGAITYTYYTNDTCTTQTSTSDGSGAASAGAAPKNVGTWYVKATAAQTAKYEAASSDCIRHKIDKYKPSVAFDPTTTTSGSVAANSTATFKAKPTTISSCQGTLTATSASTSTVTVANASGGTYGASASFSNVANNTSKTFYYKGIGYSSGTALTVSYVPTDTANCDSATTITFTASVTRLTPVITLTAKTAAQRTYTGSPIVANTATATYGGNAITLSYTYKYYTNSTCTAGETTTAPTNVGTYYVKAISTQTAQYESAESDCVNHSIVGATITGSVMISGTATWGQTLTANPSCTVPSSGCTFDNYQWYSNGTAISGATSSTYAIPKEQVGNTITVSVRAKATNYANKTLTSSATAAIAKKNLSVTATNYSGAYDGSIHYATIKVNSSNTDWNGSTIVSGTSTSYGTNVTTSGTLNTSYNLKPGYTTFTNGAKTIYYKVTGGDYYNDKTGYATVTITDGVAPVVNIQSSSGYDNTVYAKVQKFKISLSDAGSGLVATTYSVKYALGDTNNVYDCSSSAMGSTLSITASAGATTALSAEITVDTGSYSRIYICNVSAITDTAGNSIAANTTTTKTLKVDNGTPTLGMAEVGQVTGVTDRTVYAKTQTFAFRTYEGFSGFQAGTVTVKYKLYASGDTPPTCSDMTDTVTISLSEGALSYVFSNTATISSGNYDYIKFCNANEIKDRAGNIRAANTISDEYKMRVDRTAPTITLSSNSDSTFSKTKSVTVTLRDTKSGLASGASVKYGWSTSTSTAPSSYTAATLNYTDGETGAVTFTASGSGLTGTYYLWVVPTTLTDKAGNSNTTTKKSTGTFKFDNTLPVVDIQSSSGYNNEVYAPIQKFKIKLSDANGGLAADTYRVKYALGAYNSNYTCDSSQMGSEITITASAGAASALSSEITVDEGNYSRIYICNVSAITDRAGNSIDAGSTTTKILKVDNSIPTLGMAEVGQVTGVTDRTVYARTQTFAFRTYENVSGLAAATITIKYKTYASGDTPPTCDDMTNTVTMTISDGATGYTYSGTATINSGNHDYIKFCNEDAIYDKAGNFRPANTISEQYIMKVDRSGPTFEVPVGTRTTWQQSQTFTIDLKDVRSGLVAGTYAFKYLPYWRDSDADVPTCDQVQANGTSFSVTVSANEANSVASPNLTVNSGTYNRVAICNTDPISDMAGNTRPAKDIFGSNYTLNVDNTAPTASITSTNNLAASQTATLTCGDSMSKVSSYYWGTSSPTSSTTYTDITDTTSFSTTKTVSSNGTYYLSCKDAAGNVSTAASKVFYKTTLNMTNGSVTPTSVITMSGNSFNLPTPTPNTGHSNIGNWYTNSACTSGAKAYGSSYTPSSTTTLYSKATANSYTVNANANGGSIQTTSGWTIDSGNATAYESVQYGGTYGTLPTASKTGYDFVNWTNTLNYGSKSWTAASQWSYYSIYYHAMPSVKYTVTMTSAKITAGSATTFDTRIFDFTNNQGLVTANTAFSNSSISYNITAPSTTGRTNDNRLIIYAGVGGSTNGNTVQFNNIKVKTTDAAADTVYTSSSTMSTAGNHDLVAQWSAKTITIHYDANGGSGAPSNQTYTYGQSTAVNLSTTEPTRTGYDFLGWSTSSTATSASYSAGQSWSTTNVPTSGTTYNLYAVWQGKTYTIKFRQGNATSTSGYSEIGTQTTCRFGTACTLTTYSALGGVFPYSSADHAANSSHTDYEWTFSGWNTSSTGTARTYSDGGSYNPSEYAASMLIA